MLRFLFGCIFLLGTVSHASGQAWTQAPGRAYVKLAYGASTATDQFTFDGQTKLYADHVEEPAFFDRSLYLYGELGLTKRVTLVASLPYKRLFIRDTAFRYVAQGFGSAQLGVRYDLRPLLGWQDGANALSSYAAVTLPTGYHRNYAPSVGTGQVDAQASLHYGRSFYPFPGYAQVGLGYRHRSSLYSLSQGAPCQEGADLGCIEDRQPTFGDEWTASAEIGMTLGKRALVQALTQTVWSIQTPNLGFTATNPFPTHQRYVKVGGGLTLYPLPRLGLSMQAFMTPYGRSTVRSTDLFFGIEYAF